MKGFITHALTPYQVICVSVQVRLLGSVNTFTLTIVVQQMSVTLARELLLDLHMLDNDLGQVSRPD